MNKLQKREKLIRKIDRKAEKQLERMQNNFIKGIYCLIVIGVVMMAGIPLYAGLKDEAELQGIKIKWYETQWGMILISIGVTALIGGLIYLFI